MNIIIFDWEIFRYNYLLGAIVVDEDYNELKVFQSWDLQECNKFFESHRRDIWVGWNNSEYDNYMIQAMTKNQNLFELSHKIVTERFKPRLMLKFFSFDLMKTLKGFTSLKLTELIAGKNIHTTDVDFDIFRELTDEEKTLTEGYNLDDLKQTLFNLKMFKDKFQLQSDIIKEFSLSMLDNISVTGTKLAANVLKCKYDPTLQYKEIESELYPTLDLKNQDLLRFFLTKGWRTLGKGQTFSVKIAGADIDIGKGGAHSGIKGYHTEKFLYLDVSGYYNLVMINYDLLPRTMPPEGKELYDYMYHEQLKLKKTNPKKRAVYKTICLSVFGAMNNEHTDFYDPHKFILVTTTGELFICDLLEKLDGLVRVIQTNTDGIMVEPYDWANEQKIIEIVEAWERRTGFVIKKEHRYNLWQRDVNCYFCQDGEGNLEYKGEAVVNYDIGQESYSDGKIFKCKEPPIIARGIIDYLIYGITPEETVESHSKDFRWFQQGCRKESYDYLTYETQDIRTGMCKEERLSGICRVFSYKSGSELGMVFKHKDSKGKHSKSKISNLPDNVFIYNHDITTEQGIADISAKIDYQYYVDRIYERIGEFVLDEPAATNNITENSLFSL